MTATVRRLVASERSKRAIVQFPKGSTIAPPPPFFSTAFAGVFFAGVGAGAGSPNGSAIPLAGLVAFAAGGATFFAGGAARFAGGAAFFAGGGGAGVGSGVAVVGVGAGVAAGGGCGAATAAGFAGSSIGVTIGVTVGFVGSGCAAG